MWLNQLSVAKESIDVKNVIEYRQYPNQLSYLIEKEEEVIDIYVWFNFENWEKQSLFISGRERSLSEKNGKEIYNCSTVESLCFLAFLFNDLSGCNTIQNISFLP